MSTPTPEQQAVIDSQARVRVVQAVPGSGKTWLVADLIKRELTHWQPEHGGIAALSFTRVGGEEIRRAVGYILHHPHFVGTIDAFIFRFIVRPFLKQVFPTYALPRLIPAEWEPSRWQKGGNNTKLTVHIGNGSYAKDYNLFNVCFLSEEHGRPVIACKQWDWDSIAPLESQDGQIVLKAKKELWEKHGWLTHSDAAFLANKILADNTHGATIRAEVLRRFRFIIVDELQDTGWFLGQCILQLLAEPPVKGVLVGDPDQAIYEFNGARPDLFDRFASLAGTEQIPLGHTRRCSPAVCTVAENLSEPSRRIKPAPDRTGRTFLLSYKSLDADIHKLRDWFASRSDNGIVKIVARHTKTVKTIAGFTSDEAPKLLSVPFNHLHRAVNSFRLGRQVTALAAARAALEYAVFGSESNTRDDLAMRGIDPVVCKHVCVETLLEANLEFAGETFETWGKRMADFMQKQFSVMITAKDGGNGAVKIRLPGGDAKTKPRHDYLVAMAARPQKGSHVDIQTVHAVKGETHDLTVFVCPEPIKKNHCISALWWSTDMDNAEERRIAFVAITRTRGDLIVCVSEQCFGRLQNSRADFVRLFECMSIDDFIKNDCGRTSETQLVTN